MSAVSRLAKTSCRNLSTECGAGGVCLNIHTGSSGEEGHKVSTRASVGTKRRRRLRNMRKKSGIFITAPVQKQQHFLGQDLDILLLQLLHDHIAAGCWVTEAEKYLWKNNKSSFVSQQKIAVWNSVVHYCYFRTS